MGERLAAGSFVRSGYRAPWTGIILTVEPYSTWEPKRSRGEVARVLVLRSRTGRPMRKRKVATLNVRWLEPAPPIPLETVNPDWLLAKKEG